MALALVAGTAGGFAAGSVTGSRSAAPGASPAGRDAAALRERVADLERQVTALSDRPAPAATLSGSGRRDPNATAVGATDPAPVGGTEGKGVDAAGFVRAAAAAPWRFGPSETALELTTEIDEARRQQILDVATKDPEAAARATRDLWERGTPVEKDTAEDLMARAEHRAFQSLLTDALSSTPPPKRSREILRRAAGMKGSAWGVVQLTGAPDVPVPGDHSAAWASLEEDMGEVTVDLDYATAVRVDAVRIHETFNPGAVARVYAKDPGGRWDLMWEGRAETRESIRWFEPSASTSYATISIRLVLDTDRVPGWNEIDAVELVGDGRRQWATGATATSTYGTGP